MTDTTSSARSGSVLAWLVYVVQLLTSAALALLAITSVFMTDSCGSTTNDAAVCDTGYFGAVLFGYWAALAVLLVVVPFAIVRASRRGRPTWPRALAGLLATATLTVAFVMLMLR